jgi:hypothetical protein
MPIREPNPTWPIDPRNWAHPLHDEKWLEMARAIGRQIARDEMAGRGGPHIGGNDDNES